MSKPVGVVLAGGRGRRMGAEKAMVALAGRPMLTYSLRAMTAVLGQVAVVAKATSELPALPDGVEVWIEAEQLPHPLVGVIEALRRAAGRPVLVCAVDLPLITPEVISELVAASESRPLAVIAGEQPLLGCYEPEALTRLRANGPVREAVAALHPRVLEVADPDVLFNVNTREELRRAEAILASRK